jgi:hypothetical protein
MTGIFISYRREDSGPYAGRLYDALVSHFGQEGVFFDIDAIGPGEDFREVIQKTCSSCKVLLAVIGRQWATVCDKNGKMRLQSKNDTLRMEIASALQNGLRVIPVLVGGAEMPDESALPEDLQALAYRNAWDLSDKRFHYDVEQLVSALRNTLSADPQSASIRAPRKTEGDTTPRTSKSVPKKKAKAVAPPSRRSSLARVDDSSSLYPIYGIILGKTTTREIEKIGQKNASVSPSTGKQYPYYEVEGGTQFWYDESSKIVTTMWTGTLVSAPEPWQELGFQWKNSYDQWLSMLKDMDYSIQIKEKPHIEEDGSLAAKVVAKKDGPYPHEMELSFYGRKTTSEEGGLMSIDIYPLDEDEDEDT